MQDTRNKSDYYSYQDAARLLEISYAHLTRCIEFGVFHPVRLGKGAKKYIPKSEVNVKIGQVLYDFRKPKRNKFVERTKKFAHESAAPAPGNINDMVASEALKTLATAMGNIEEQMKQMEARMDSGENITRAEFNAMWQQAMHASQGLLPLLKEYDLETEEVVMTQEEADQINAGGEMLLINPESMTFIEYKENIRKFGLQADDDEIDNT